MNTTPIEKAKELVDKFKEIYPHKGMSKNAAIILVDEILSILFQHHEIDYWKEVKEEIQKL